ncbi:MAG TPA: alpha/beta hydrolase [Vicinamibacterales bacterium]|nr:alpha/beta hydrolase [Vicinamibacterales bacterium]
MTIKRRVARTSSAVAAAMIVACQHVPVRSQFQTELARRSGALEQIPKIESIYGVLRTREGQRLRTIVTRPQGSTQRLPGVLFIQWLSCSTVELPEKSNDGWSRMLRRLIQESGFVVWRTEKAGVGDSEGDCAALDYDTELSHHRQALDAFRQSSLVDPTRIVVFGASMGANMAPLVASGQPLAGVVTWGGGAKTWFERQLGFSRRAMELSGDKPEQISGRMTRHARFYAEYLLNGRLPSQISKEDASLGDVWRDIPGVDGGLHYGRPPLFHQQAQRQDWTAAWATITAPVLVLYGEHDWFEDVSAAQTILRAINRESAERVLKVIPRMDHHFAEYPSPEAAFREQGGTVNEEPVIREILMWLRRLI